MYILHEAFFLQSSQPKTGHDHRASPPVPAKFSDEITQSNAVDNIVSLVTVENSSSGDQRLDSTLIFKNLIG